MSELIQSRLLSLLACPDCRAELCTDRGQLRCAGCARTYEVRDGIPILYARLTDPAHVQVEEDMVTQSAETFRVATNNPRTERRALHEAAQWRRSKDDFWRIVESLVQPDDTIANIGCGDEAGTTDFERRGHFVAHVDIVFENVRRLRTTHGAQACVVGDLRHLPLKPESFDCVTCLDVIHHEFDQVPESLRSLRYLLRTGGHLFLQDPNAWGMFQFYKSMLLPRRVHRTLRSAYHRLRRSLHKPADYEFPTNPSTVTRELRRLGFEDIRMHPNDAYPFVGPLMYRFYRCFSGIEWVRKYHNFHYTLSAVRSPRIRPHETDPRHASAA